MKNKVLTMLGLAALLCCSAPAYGADTDPGQLLSRWKDQGHLSVYGMVPIHGCDVKDGQWTAQIRSGVKCQDVQIQVQSGDMILTFQAEEESLTEKLPEWQQGLTLEPVTSREEGEAVPLEIRQDAEGIWCTLELDALNADYTLAAGEASTSFWVNASTLPEEALKIDLPDYSVIREAMTALEEDAEEHRLVNEPFEPMEIDLEDGEYAIECEIFGGSGKAAVDTPTYLYVRDGKAYARLRWSSSYYDYMIVGGQRYENQAEPEKNSIFEIPVRFLDEEMTVVADTLAMGTPHEIVYGLKFYGRTIGDVSQMPREAAKRVVVIALVIIVGGGILNHYVKKKRSSGTGTGSKKHRH